MASRNNRLRIKYFLSFCEQKQAITFRRKARINFCITSSDIRSIINNLFTVRIVSTVCLKKQFPLQRMHRDQTWTNLQNSRTNQHHKFPTDQCFSLKFTYLGKFPALINCEGTLQCHPKTCTMYLHPADTPTFCF